MAASDARPQPLKNTAFRFYFSMRRQYGEFATEIENFGAAISKDGGNVNSTVNTPVEVQGDSGICYLDLTASEMNADAVCVRLSATGTIDMLFVLFPAEANDFGLIADAVWDEPMSGHSVNGSYGAHFVRSANQNQNTVAITGSNHIAADIHELQPNVINASHIATDAIDADALAASAVSEISTGLLTLLGGTPVTVNAPVSGGNYRIDIIRGDTYNDIRKPKLRFTVAKNYTGCTITLTIRHRTSDAILLTKTGTVDSATLLSVELTGTDTAFSTLSLDEYGLHVFDLQATDGSSNRETIIVGGSAVLLLDQSR